MSSTATTADPICVYVVYDAGDSCVVGIGSTLAQGTALFRAFCTAHPTYEPHADIWLIKHPLDCLQLLIDQKTTIFITC